MSMYIEIKIEESDLLEGGFKLSYMPSGTWTTLAELHAKDWKKGLAAMQDSIDASVHKMRVEQMLREAEEREAAAEQAAREKFENPAKEDRNHAENELLSSEAVPVAEGA
jgi:exopolyphosphatase/pppGpp-phosphohydrolase